MVAPRRTKNVVCSVIQIPTVAGTSHPDRIRVRPSDLLPWADPYIARLVDKLQSEVRLERIKRRHFAPTRLELDPPSPVYETEGDWHDPLRRPPNEAPGGER